MVTTSSRLSIRIVLANGGKLGPTKIALLEAIAAHGSISGAARSLGVSYRGAWLSLASINSMLCGPVGRDGERRSQEGRGSTYADRQACCRTLPRDPKPGAKRDS
jgi:molybdenum-dependent DNA-binding transcriptional regulator ModE